MRYGRIWCAVLLLLALSASVVRAESGPLTTEPRELTISGTLVGGNLVASLRLLPQEELTGVQLFFTDFRDVTGDGRYRPPLSASGVTLLPATEFPTLTAGSLTQVVVQVAPPTTAGRYTSTLIIHWEGPAPGRLEVPVMLDARTQPTLALEDPTQLALNGNRGEVLTRQVLLRETAGGSSLTGLEVIAQDLRSSEGEVLEAGNISVTLPMSQLEGGDLLAVTVTVDLRGVRAGAYSGNLRFRSDTGALVSLPLTVNVRHSWPLPALSMLVGVSLGLWIAWYQAQGRARDQLWVRVGRIRKALENDTGLAEVFGEQLRSLLGQVEGVLALALYPQAEALLGQAEQILDKWYNTDQKDWQKLVTYLRDELLPQLEGLAAQARIAQPLYPQAQALLAAVATYADPTALRKKIVALEAQLASYRKAQTALEHIGKARLEAPVSSQVKASWQQLESQLTKRMNALPADDSAGWEQLLADINALAEQIARESQAQAEALLGAPKGAGETARGAGALTQLLDWLGLEVTAESRTPQVHAAKPKSPKEKAALWRLTIYNIIIYGIGGLLLAGVGYNNLYLGQPTFGTTWVMDYLGLLGWGLGAETSLSSIAGLLSSWGVPFKQPTGGGGDDGGA